MPDAAIPVLLFRVADLTCAVPAAHVMETMRPLPITPMDDMPSFVSGVSTIRGVTTPVVDLAALLQRHSDRPSRFVTVRSADRVVALAVDDVLGVSPVTPAEFESRPPLLSGTEPLVTMLAKKDAALYLVLDTTRLVDVSGTSR